MNSKIERVEVPVKCEIPEIPKPQYIEPRKEHSHYDILRILLYNYAECRNYVENLLKAIEVCR
ncbi:MAG: hypothetical protein ABDI07_11805 [Candidatus Kryptonium sp.]